MAGSIWNGTITFGLVAVPVEEVDYDEIDPGSCECTYYLGTRDEGRDAYALLHAALEQTLAEIKG